MAYWYLRNFPEDYERFLDLNQETPTCNDMQTNIEGKQGKAPRPNGARLAQAAAQLLTS